MSKQTYCEYENTFKAFKRVQCVCIKYCWPWPLKCQYNIMENPYEKKTTQFYKQLICTTKFDVENVCICIGMKKNMWRKKWCIYVNQELRIYLGIIAPLIRRMFRISWKWRYTTLVFSFYLSTLYFIELEYCLRFCANLNAELNGKDKVQMDLCKFFCFVFQSFNINWNLWGKFHKENSREQNTMQNERRKCEKRRKKDIKKSAIENLCKLSRLCAQYLFAGSYNRVIWWANRQKNWLFIFLYICFCISMSCWR